jgi:hypothetical protein
MSETYQYSKPLPNPYLPHVAQQITLTVSNDVVQYFQQLEAQIGLPYQNLMVLYLRDCAARQLKLNLDWGTDDEGDDSSIISP